MEGKDISESKGKSSLPQADVDQPQTNIEANGGVLIVKEEAAMAISKTPKKKSELKSNVAKKRGALHMLRVALFMLRRRSGKKSKSVEVEIVSKGLWKKLVGSMRPLHLHDHQPHEALEPAPAPAPVGLPNSKSMGNIQEMVSSTTSPESCYSSSSPASSSSGDGISRYASAQSLMELGRSAGCNYDDEIDRYASTQSLQELGRRAGCYDDEIDRYASTQSLQELGRRAGCYDDEIDRYASTQSLQELGRRAGCYDDEIDRYASTQSLQELGRRAGCYDDEIDRSASAQSLRELGRKAGFYDDEIDNDFLETGDEMIDAKAEEFISNFYKQMKLQRLESIKCYNEMMKRGSN
ncbi:hypothetical protein NE237_014990 [Protea cynaroides]|uniref:Uncharacterized protein n=1 Tax=Protea cynaroides TaxID=273540 RepID=A0A9Q0KDB0_9MAGN|nr:hypothetical protein NE237_014990 [Protea cynaroides]